MGGVWVWSWILIAGGTVLVVGLVLWLMLLLSLRLGLDAGVDAIRRMNRRMINPRAMRTAGQPGAATSIVEHVGRTTGTGYRTPVGGIDTGDGFVVVLPYGRRADWLRNVLAAGSAVVVHEGLTFRIRDPQVVATTDMSHVFARRERMLQRLYGITLCLRAQKVDPGIDHHR